METKMATGNPLSDCDVPTGCCTSSVKCRLTVSATNGDCADGDGGILVFDGEEYWIGAVSFNCNVEQNPPFDCQEKSVMLRLSCKDVGAGIVLILEASVDGGTDWFDINHDGGCDPVMNLTTTNIWDEVGCSGTASTEFIITE